MSQVLNSILETIGNTPIVRLNKVTPKNTIHEYFVKLEYFNPGLSVKDRIAMALVEGAEKSGELKPGGTIIEATSGNTGMGLATVAAVKGYKAIFIMPDKISEEKRAILRAYGAKVVITPTAVEPEDPRSYISVAKTLNEITPNSFLTNQYHNPNNPNEHFKTTGPEIWNQMDGQIDAFFAGAGTGGTISGVGRYLKSKNQKVQIVCPDPVGSILYDLYYHKKIVDPPKSYKVEGVGEDMLPDNVHMDVIDGFVKVTDLESFTLTRELVAKEAICVGPSSAMNLAGAFHYAEANFKTPMRILVLMPDSGRSYLSKAFSESWLRENSLMPSLLATQSVQSMVESKAASLIESVGVQATVSEVVARIKSSSQKFLAVEAKSEAGPQLIGVLYENDIMNALLTGAVRGNEPIIHLLKENFKWVSPTSSVDDIIADVSALGAVFLERKSNGYLAITQSDLLTFMAKLD